MLSAADEVLQENIILSGVREDGWHQSRANTPVAISSSRGIRDIGATSRREVPSNTVLEFASVDKVLRLPVCDEDDDALALVDSWPSSLHSHGLNISTGPVVPFRATELIDKEGHGAEIPTYLSCG